MKIGNLEIKGYVALAPMASAADRAFREICADFGSAYTVSEMVSSKGVMYQNKNTSELLENTKSSTPFAAQLFGNEPQTMAYAAKEIMKYSPDMIDINMGCPVPKVCSNGCGSALMKNPKLCGEIVKAVKDAVDVPVTVKIRKGWDNSNINAVEVAKICEESGASAVAVHARTKEEMYQKGIDLDIIAKIKKELSVPVIGNGDIVDEQSAVQMLETTGCDMIMVGRAALGNPFIFSRLNAYLNHGRIIPKPTVSQTIDVMLKHIQLLCKYKGEKHGMLEARKHVAWYIKGLNGAAAFRNEAGYLTSFEELIDLTKRIYEKNKNQSEVFMKSPD